MYTKNDLKNQLKNMGLTGNSYSFVNEVNWRCTRPGGRRT